MIGKMRDALAFATLFLVVVAPAAAQGTGALTSKIELEKSMPASEGQPVRTTYVTPDVVVPGDRVRITLTFTNSGVAPAAGVNLVNPIPAGLIFDDTADTAGFAVSVDGGKSFGALAALAVGATNAAPRPAAAADVTHVRWQWPDAIGPGGTRTVAFFGRVQ